jgi:glucan-binding YG repeat protein
MGYKDSTGNSVKNTWVQNYFVQADGNMATGWLNNNGKWYYLGDDGARKTGWQLVNGNWYYLDSQGTMQVGWIKDISNGKYYYLNNDGSMAYNTTIGEYKLGSDGAWYNR